MLEIVRVLNDAAPLDWYSYIPVNADKGNTTYPPLITWRFATPNEHIKASIESAIRSYQGRVEWSLSFEGPNWGLTPKRVETVQDQRQVKNIADAIAMLGEEDPGFGEEAHRDLDEITERLRGLQKNRLTS